jgi:hypothetical protein
LKWALEKPSINSRLMSGAAGLDLSKSVKLLLFFAIVRRLSSYLPPVGP